MAASEGAAAGPEGMRRSLPGWSLGRETPRPKRKQGWECPAPTVEDWEDYKKWKEEQDKKEELPAAPQIFLADSSLLFYQDPAVQLPWIHRLKCELPRRVGRLSGDLPVKASYVGFGTYDEPGFFDLFKRAVAQIGVVLCRQIHHPPSRFELAHLEQSDLILVGGGDRRRLWETLGTDVGGSVVAEHVKWRYLQGAVVVALGEAMSLLGEKSWYHSGENKTVVPFTGWKIFPHVVASEAEGLDLEEIVEQLGGAGVVILGVHRGGGMIFNKDGLVEPVRTMLQEYRWDWQTNNVKQALLIGPPRNTGLICPLYAAMRRGQGEAGEEDEEEVDAWSYALTQDEEQEEEHLIEQFDPHSLWLPPQARSEVESLKRQGNEAFKAGKADLAMLTYQRARVLLKSNAQHWSELDPKTRGKLDALEAPKKKAQLPSERRQQAEAGGEQKEDFRASTLLTSLLLNICACRLLAYAQDEDAKRTKAERPSACTPGGDDATGRGADPVPAAGSAQPGASGAGACDTEETTLVELRDNLVEAFRAANEALALSGGRSAKAWYRRGCAFERMRDPRNALRDFEEGLLRAPGDGGLARKRDEVREAAGKVAEIMYFARHRELDAQEARLGLEGRRALVLRGGFGDSFKDERGEFALAQPLARLVEATLEEVDGKPRLVASDAEPEMPAADAPYLHSQALWTWEFLVQRAPALQLLRVVDVDLGAGPLEWLCKGLRTHAEVRVLRLEGVHLGPAGAKMLRNVIAQSRSLLEVALDSCGLLDQGLDEVADGLRDCPGQLETLSVRSNHVWGRRLGRLAEALGRADGGLDLAELDLSGNPFGPDGSREVARIVGSNAHRLRALRLQDCLVDLVGFWRLVANLDDGRPLAQLDLRCNPIGRGTRRCWRSQMGPSIRCEVLLSDHPLKARRAARRSGEEADLDAASYPLPGRWV